MTKIIILSNEHNIEEVLLSYWFDTYTASFDRIIFHWLYRELIEKYSSSMELLCKKNWLHINTLFRAMYFLKIYDKSVYLKLIPRVKKFLDIYRIKIYAFKPADEEIEVLNEIWVVYSVYPKLSDFILTIKKWLCQ